MRHRNEIVALVLAGAFALTGLAAEKPPENYQKSMKDLGAFSQGIDKAMSDADYDAITKYAVSAKEAFGTVEHFWRSKKASDAANGKAEDATKADVAAKAAAAGANAAADLGVAASLRSAEGIAFAAKAITGLCMDCHAAHRERLPDGTFEIK